MTTHAIKLDRYHACAEGVRGRLVLGTWASYGIEQLQLSYGEGWQGRVVYASYMPPYATEPTKVLVGEDGIVAVPPEATASAGFGTVTIVGTDEASQLISVDVPYMVMSHSPVDGNESAPTPDKWEQYIAQVQSIVDKAVPPDGTVGYVLTKGVDGNAWAPQTGGGGGGGVVPAGGTTGQVLTKSTDIDYDVKWAAPDDTALKVISDAGDEAVADIAKAQSSAVSAVEDAQTKGQSAITGAAVQALEAIGQTERAAIQQVQTTGTAQVDDVNQAGEAKISEINAANAHAPQINAETGKWQTWDAQSGQYVDTDTAAQGPKGDTGPAYTLTETDKQEIVQDVLDALPNGDEVSY